MSSSDKPAGSGAKAVQLQRAKTSALIKPKDGIFGVVSDADLAKPYDVIVIGGGPAGVAAAQKAAFLGRRALLIDDAKCPQNELDLAFGAPTGLYSKALRDTAKHVDVDLLARMGLDEKVIWAQVQSSVTKLAANNALTQMAMMTEFKIGYLRARAKLTGAADALTGVVAALKDGTEHTIASSCVLIATGSTPTRPDVIPFDDTRLFDSDSIATLTFLPKRVVISGAGIIAIEYAKIFAKLHAKVTMLVRGEATSSLARIGLDPHIVKGLLDDLAESGVTVLTNTSADKFIMPADPTDPDDPVTVTLKGKEGSDTPELIECDIFLAAMGRRPTTSGLAVEDLGGTVDAKSGIISVDDTFKVAGAPDGVYAAGDVIGPPALASTGVEQAKSATSVMFGESTEDKADVGRDNFPVGVWTIPEIGYYGFTKEAAAKKGIDAEEGMAEYSQCLRGRVFAPQGFLKLVFDRNDGRIVGVHIFGTDACELIHFGMELVNSKRSIFDVMSMLFVAVTFHELFKFAALDGNSKLQFGMQWRTILKELGAVVNKDDLQSLRAKFDELDTDKSGELDANELMAVFDGLGKGVTKGTLSNMLRLADKDGGGTIGFDEFAAIIQAV
jgi:NAD(P) transhydrogenase